MRDWMLWQYQRFLWWRRRTAERGAMALAWKLPRWLVYWCAIRLGAHATTGRYGSTNPTEMPFTEALERWDR